MSNERTVEQLHERLAALEKLVDNLKRRIEERQAVIERLLTTVERRLAGLESDHAVIGDRGRLRK